MLKLSVMTVSKTFSLFFCLGITTFTSTAALALNIYNQDNKMHEVEVTFDKYGTTRGPINPNTRDSWYSSDCGKGCMVKVNGVGQVNNVKNDDLIVIKDGTLTVVKAVESSSK